MSTNDPALIDFQEDRPLVSFILLAYNQERFIREAVEGAFSQTYSPLEIILSDDCSTDSTYQVIQEMAASYTGPHKVIVRQNETNQGIGFHFNKVMAATSGEFIVVAAGDDISLPERSEVMFQEWDKLGRPVCSMQSESNVIDCDGIKLGNFKKKKLAGMLDLLINIGGGLHGASHCFHKDVFFIFGDFKYKLIAEDIVMSARALMVSRLVDVDRSLVKWRSHSSNISDPSVASASYRMLRKRLESSAYQSKLMYLQVLTDLNCCHSENNISPKTAHKCSEELNLKIRYYNARCLVLSSSPTNKVRGVCSMLAKPIKFRSLLIILYQAFLPSPWVCYNLLPSRILQLLPTSITVRLGKAVGMRVVK